MMLLEIDIVGGFVTFMFLLVIVGLGAKFISFIATDEYSGRRRLAKPVLKKRLKDIDIYLDQFDYYRALSDLGKKKFKIRVEHYLRTKTFNGREGLKVTQRMRVMVCSSMAQLTFGLENYKIKNYRYIILYPDSFYSPQIGQRLKGGTTHNGIVMLSWQDFEHGYKIPDDRYNLGLHELAHAFKLNILGGHAEDHTDGFMLENLEERLKVWEKKAMPEMLNMRKRSSSFLRAYAKTNDQEFFAVSVEHFFEWPDKFKASLPVLYKEMTWLLNQDPLNVDKDYRFSSAKQ
jgi:Mlc titration factor MtfA (ptsG expression regulator)